MQRSWVRAIDAIPEFEAMALADGERVARANATKSLSCMVTRIRANELDGTGRTVYSSQRCVLHVRPGSGRRFIVFQER